MPNYLPGGYSSEDSDYSDTDMYLSRKESVAEITAPENKEKDRRWALIWGGG